MYLSYIFTLILFLRGIDMISIQTSQNKDGQSLTQRFCCPLSLKLSLWCHCAHPLAPQAPTTIPRILLCSPFLPLREPSGCERKNHGSCSQALIASAFHTPPPLAIPELDTAAKKVCQSCYPPAWILVLYCKVKIPVFAVSPLFY